MHRYYAISLLVALVFSSGYFYREVAAVCATPLSYRIGSIDEAFTITEDEARLAIADAESVWEQATGQNLFTYDPEAEFTINFVFDERQELANEEITLRTNLTEAEGFNEEIREAYAELTKQYDTLQYTYESRSGAYEERLNRYNDDVARYNADGGAPPDVFDRLEAERNTLNGELQQLNDLAAQLNTLGAEINDLSERGNAVVEKYNDKIEEYNERFGQAREFTQGDYQGDTINIYKFSDDNELRLVLAHELGHALWLDHVAGDSSIMYDHLGAQPSTLVLTQEDLDEFNRVCGPTTRSWLERLRMRFSVY